MEREATVNIAKTIPRRCQCPRCQAVAQALERIRQRDQQVRTTPKPQRVEEPRTAPRPHRLLTTAHDVAYN